MSHMIHEVKFINHTIKKVVFGYIRQCESLLQHSESIYTIPLIISSICCIYYHQKETFISSRESILKVTKNNTVIESLPAISKYLYQENISYGSTNIQPSKNPNTKFQWKIKLLAVNDRIRLGIFTPFRGTFYGVESTGKLYKNYSPIVEANCIGKWGNYYCPRFKTNDTVTIEFNVKNRTLQYYLNNTNLGIAFKNIPINIHYNFGVVLRRNDKAEILYFQDMIVNDEIETSDYNITTVESMLRLNVNIAELVIELLRIHTIANCNHEMEIKIKQTITNNCIDARQLLVIGRKQFLRLLRDNADVKLGHGCKAFKYIEQHILNR
eukprot:161744_1